MARAGGWPLSRPLPCLQERDEVGSSTGRPGVTGQDRTGQWHRHGEDLSPPLQAAVKSLVSKATWGSHSWEQAELGWDGMLTCPSQLPAGHPTAPAWG